MQIKATDFIVSFCPPSFCGIGLVFNSSQLMTLYSSAEAVLITALPLEWMAKQLKLLKKLREAMNVLIGTFIIRADSGIEWMSKQI